MKKYVLITGALGGIGQALCTTFQKAGYAVIATDRLNGRCACDHFIRLDIARLAASEPLRRKITAQVQKISGGGLHSLVNNAAVQILNRTAAVKMSDWRESLDTNLIAPFLLTQMFLPDLAKSGGSVVNIASIHATATKPGFVCYATTKAALTGLTRALAVDLGGKVRINSICPAATATPMLLAGFKGKPAKFKELAAKHPLGRIAEPKEVAQVALFLASDQASFITGCSLSVDGGIGARLHDPE